MKIHCISGQSYDSNIYVFSGKNPTIVDCGTGLMNDYVIKEINNIIKLSSIKQIIITHEHFDHCGGVKRIHELSNKNALIFCHVDASEKIEHGESMFARMLGGVMPNIPVDIKLKEGDDVNIGNSKFQVIHTPGHSPGSMCLYDTYSKSLISGDTVFSFGSFGRYDFEGGSLSLLKSSIEKLSKFDIKNLYPGHMDYVEDEGNKHMKMVLRNIKML